MTPVPCGPAASQSRRIAELHSAECFGCGWRNLLRPAYRIAATAASDLDFKEEVCERKPDDQRDDATKHGVQEASPAHPTFTTVFGAIARGSVIVHASNLRFRTLSRT